MRTYFWTSTATVMWCYRCGAAFSYSSQVTCWFSTAQRHHTIRACTIQRWVRCVQGLFMYMDMDTMYKTYNLRALNRHTSSHIWKCYENTNIFFIAYVSCALYVEKMVIWWKYIHWIFLRAIHNLRLRLCIGYDRQNSDSILHTVYNLPMYCTVRVHTHWASIE